MRAEWDRRYGEFFKLDIEEEKDKILFRILDVEISEYAKRKALRQTGLERTITRVISESCHGFVG